MVTNAVQQRREQIKQLATAIATGFKPEQIILFGSHARGEAKDTSDVDLLVVLPHSSRNRTKAIEILRETLPSFAVDLLVRTPGEMQQRLVDGDLLLRDIVANGTVLYDSARH